MSKKPFWLVAIVATMAMAVVPRVSGDNPPVPAYVTQVSIVPDGTYRAGQLLSFAITFDRTVTLSGTASIQLTIGAASVSAIYDHGSPGNNLSFYYTIGANDADLDGITIGSTISLSSGTLRDNYYLDANLSFTPPNTSGIRVDTTAPPAPSITSITTDTGSSPADRITSDNTLTINGSAEANSVVTVSRIGVGVLGTTTANGFGDWNYNYGGTALADGTHTFTATVTDAGGNISGASAGFVVTVDTTAPTITHIADRTIGVGGNTGAVGFTMSDAGTTPANLTLGKVSNNQTLVPDANIVFGGAGASRTVTVTPTAGQYGAATITVTVTDAAGNSSSDTFSLTVNAAPTLAIISNPAPINEDAGQQIVNLSGITSGGESQTLTLTVVSGNTGLIPTPTVTYVSPNTTGTLTYTPVPNASGTADIMVTVNDGAAANNLTTRTFTVTVQAVNDPPTITSFNNQVINEDTSTTALPFTIGDIDGPVTSLTVTRWSSVQTLIPDANIVIGVAGQASQTVTVTPAANQSGIVNVTLTVTDAGGAVATTTFQVTVNAVNDPPVVTLASNPITFTEGTPNPILIDDAGTVGDIDSNDFNTGTLTVDFQSGGLAEDRLGIKHQGTSTQQVGISGNSVSYENVTIGTFTGGTSGTTPLVVTLNANATYLRVQGLVQAITYDNASRDNPTVSTRIVRMVLTDGDGGTSAAALRNVNVVGVNDAPTITGLSSVQIEFNGTTPTLNFTVNDEETAAGSLTVTKASTDTALIPLANITLGVGGSPSVRTVVITPATGMSGSATVTLTVSDGPRSTDMAIEVTVFSKLPTPSLSAAFNTDHSTATVSATAQPGTVYYTTDGFSVPDSNSSTVPPQFGTATTVKARAIQSGYTSSDVATLPVTAAAGVVFNPAGHDPISYSVGPLGVQMSAEAGATVLYKAGTTGSWLSTTSGSTPSIDGIDNGSGTIQAYAYTATKLRGPPTTSDSANPFKLRLANPTSTVSYSASGYASGSLTFSAQSGATIRYTTDLSVPGGNTPNVYSTPLSYSNPTKVYAKAFKSGYIPSGHMSSWVNQLPSPKIADANGLVSGSVTVYNAVDIWLLPNFGYPNMYSEERSMNGWSSGAASYSSDSPGADYPGSFRGAAGVSDRVNPTLATLNISQGRTYSQAGWFRNINASPISRDYAGIINYDKNGNLIGPEDVLIEGTAYPINVTYLSQPLANGATTAYLANEGIFSPVDNNWYGNFFAPLLNFSSSAEIAGGNQPATLKDLMQLITMSQTGNPQVTSVNTASKTVTLSPAYTGAALPAGTAVAHRGAGSALQYSLIAGNATPTSWTRYTSTYTAMRAGSEKAAVHALISRDTGTSATTGLEFWEGTQSDRPNLYYTLNGSTAVFGQTPVTGPVRLTLNGNSQGDIRLAQRGTYYIDSAVTQRTITFKVADPTLVLSATPSGNQVNITASCATANAQIYYTTDNSPPSTSSTLYTGPVAVTASMTVNFRAFKSDYLPSAVTSQGFSPLSVPTFSQPAGTYDNDLTLTVTAPSGSQLKFLRPKENILDPSRWEPGTFGSQAGFAALGGAAQNAIVSQSTPYGIDDRVWGTIWDAASDADGGWNTTAFPVDTTKIYRFSVWINKSGGSDGGTLFGCGHSTVSDLTGDSTEVVNLNPYFAGSPSIPANTWYLWVGHVYPAGYTGIASPNNMRLYTVNGASSYGGTEYKWLGSTAVSFHRAYFYYNTDPNVHQYLWNPRVEIVDAVTDPISVLFETSEASPKTIALSGNVGNQIEAVSYSSSGLASPVSRKTYIFKVGNPVVAISVPAHGTSATVTASTTTLGAQIRYTLDGSEPSEISQLYSNPLVLSQAGTVKWKAFKAKYNPSDTMSSVVVGAAAPVVTMTPDASGGQGLLTASSTTPGAVIRYTTNGSEPDHLSTQYSGAVTMSPGSAVRWKTFSANYLRSSTTVTEVASLSEPIFNVESGTYDNDISINVTAAPGAQLKVWQSGVNLLDPSTWLTGTPGSQPGFTENGQDSENIVEYRTTPYGTTEKVWVGGNDTAVNADGGFTAGSFPVSKTSRYRFSVWIRKTGGTSGGSYFGVAANTVSSLTGSSSESVMNNPYFAYASNLPLNEWHQFIGFVQPAGHTGSTTYGRIYDSRGQALGTSASDFKWLDATTTTTLRAFLYDSPDQSVRQEFWNPRVEAVANVTDPWDAPMAVAEASPKTMVISGNVNNEVHALSYLSGSLSSGTARRVYRFKVGAPLLTATYSGANVILSATTTTTGAQIYYTTNGTEPTTASLYFNSASVTLPASTATKWKAFKANYTSSDTVVFTGSTDLDADGLPDAWEQTNFGNLNQSGSGDPDGDGLDNLREWQDGSSPNTANIRFNVHRPRAGARVF